MKWFRKKEAPIFIQCFFCSAQVKETDLHILQYAAKDGNGSINVCPICASTLSSMIGSEAIEETD